MFEKMSTLAEKLATSISESRRGFLSRLGQAALGAAGVVGALLLSGTASAQIPYVRCIYLCPDRTVCWIVQRYCQTCPRPFITCRGMQCSFVQCR
jgi:hypothetical protein